MNIIHIQISKVTLVSWIQGLGMEIIIQEGVVFHFVVFYLSVQVLADNDVRGFRDYTACFGR